MWPRGPTDDYCFVSQGIEDLTVHKSKLRADIQTFAGSVLSEVGYLERVLLLEKLTACFDRFTFVLDVDEHTKSLSIAVSRGCDIGDPCCDLLTDAEMRYFEMSMTNAYITRMSYYFRWGSIRPTDSMDESCQATARWWAGAEATYLWMM